MSPQDSNDQALDNSFIAWRIRDCLYTFLDQISGIKVLLFDNYTSGILTTLIGRLDLCDHNVYLTYPIDECNRFNNITLFQYLKAFVFVSPTTCTISSLLRELGSPHFLEYHIVFSSRVDSKILEKLAKADIYSRVLHIQQAFICIQLISPQCFTLEIPLVSSLMSKSPALWNLDDHALCDRIINGIISSLLLLKRKKFIGTFLSSSSTLSQHLVEQLYGVLRDTQYATQSFNDSEQEASGAFLFLIDRRDDLLTPLLLSWSYQAMVHEYIGLSRNRVAFYKTQSEAQISTSPVQHQDVLSCFTDHFFAKHWNSCFGELGVAIQEMLSEYTESCKKVGSPDHAQDTKNLASECLELRKQYRVISRHVEILHFLNETVKKRKLMQLSCMEQEIVCSQRPREHLDALLEVLDQSDIEINDKIHLVHIFVLLDPEVTSLKLILSKLQSLKVGEHELDLVKALSSYGHGKQRNSLSTSTDGKKLLDLARNLVPKSFLVPSNVYNQHQSHTLRLVESFLKKKIHKRTDYLFNEFEFHLSEKAQSYSFLEKAYNSMPTWKTDKIDLCIFFLGGATYHEVCDLHKLSEKFNCSILVGGTTFHNSKSFIQELISISKSSCPFNDENNSPALEIQLSEVGAGDTQNILENVSRNRDYKLEEKKKFVLQDWSSHFFLPLSGTQIQTPSQY